MLLNTVCEWGGVEELTKWESCAPNISSYNLEVWFMHLLGVGVLPVIYRFDLFALLSGLNERGLGQPPREA